MKKKEKNKTGTMVGVFGEGEAEKVAGRDGGRVGGRYEAVGIWNGAARTARESVLRENTTVLYGRSFTSGPENGERLKILNSVRVQREHRHDGVLGAPTTRTLKQTKTRGWSKSKQAWVL